MSRSSAYRPQAESIMSAQVAVRAGTLAWVLAAVVGTVVVVRNGDAMTPWLLTCAIGIISGIGGLLFLRRKARGR